jgi:hypothetical protein
MTPAQVSMLLDDAVVDASEASAMHRDGVDEDGIPYGAERMTLGDLSALQQAADNARRVNG